MCYPSNYINYELSRPAQRGGNFLVMSKMDRGRHCSSAPRCQLNKSDSISALSNSIFDDIIGLARTSQEYLQRFLRTDKKIQFLHKFQQNVIQYFKTQTNFGLYCRYPF